MAVGAATGSIALVAFGLDSVIDGSASAALAWRFRLELRGTSLPVKADRRAAQAVALAMLAAGIYVLAQAVRSLILQVRPGQSVSGLVLLASSLAVLPVLAHVQAPACEAVAQPRAAR